MQALKKLSRHLRNKLHNAKRDADFYRAKQVLLASGDLTEAEKTLLQHVSLQVHSADAMYIPGCAVDYLTAGLSASHCIQASLRAVGKQITAGAILDFPCGFGRVLRFLKGMFPAADIIVGEIQPDALDFCQHTFSVSAFLSDRDLNRIVLPQKFDLIWCGSLMTHLDEPAVCDLLHFFYRQLAEGGVCVFTAHGQRVASIIETRESTYGLSEESQKNILSQFFEKGYGYADYMHQTGYGMSLATRSHIVQLARRVGAWEPVLYLENGWHTIQDQ